MFILESFQKIPFPEAQYITFISPHRYDQVLTYEVYIISMYYTVTFLISKCLLNHGTIVL